MENIRCFGNFGQYLLLWDWSVPGDVKILKNMLDAKFICCKSVA